MSLMKHRRRGQALTEFALILPVLMLVMLIAIDAGRLFYGWVNVNNAARIAANYAAAAPASSFGPGSAYESSVLNETNNSNCALVAVSAPTFAPDSNVGSSATVSLSCRFKLLTPFIGGLVGNPLMLSATSIFVLRGGYVAGVPVAPPGFPTPTPGPTITPAPSATPAPTATPIPVCPSGQLNVPNLVGLKVKDARSAWFAAGFTGVFSPSPGNPTDQKTVTGQNPPVGECHVPSQTMTVTHS